MISFLIVFGITLALVILAFSQWDHVETWAMDHESDSFIMDKLEDAIWTIGEAIDIARESVSPVAALKTRAFIGAYVISAIITAIITL